MNDDLDGAIDDSRAGQHGPDQRPEDRLARTDAEGVVCEGDVDDVLEGAPAKQAEAQNTLEELLAIREWYGALPRPEDFTTYPSEVQQKIVEWTDRDIKANCDDESRRQDRLVDAEIAQSKMGLILSAVIIVASMTGAALVAIYAENIAIASMFLAIPFATIVGNLFRPIKSRSNGAQGAQARQDKKR